MSSEQLVAGRLLDRRFELEAPIGEGGFGIVWKARDATRARSVAIKFLKPVRAKHYPSLVSFEREIKLLASIDHRGVARVVHVGADGDMPFVVTDFAEGP